jgi:hypothetical protein
VEIVIVAIGQAVGGKAFLRKVWIAFAIERFLEQPVGAAVTSGLEAIDVEA